MDLNYMWMVYGIQGFENLVEFFMNKIKSINAWVYVLPLVTWHDQVGGWMLAG